MKKTKKCIYSRLSAMQKVVPNGCWGWLGSTNGRGYGQLSSRHGRGGSPEKAHRVSYEFHHGPIPKGMVVCHKCDNPPCTNPNHLFLGTQKDNMIDCSKKGRINKKSFENLNHERSLNPVQVGVIKSINFKAQNGRGPGVSVKDVAAAFGVSESTITKLNTIGINYGKWNK